ncbi:TetR/AcrR family transcriptional regulator [Ascidiimonas sp. W6]|uniref:TetR/AcrR family transcriptional regulator n=1 Tax=Ascidiimonas meishanensis TaxID=3128903 RepID=UPI0030EDF285
MKSLLSNISVHVNNKLYLKNPESSELGKKIIENSINMIYEVGFEKFTFRKLGDQIGSNESSIYRYFENKHKLLLYLSSWYWGWIEYKLVFTTNSIPDANEKLRQALIIITETVEEDSSFSHINEVYLNKILISEHSKSYLTKEIDLENKEGYFTIYKRLILRLTEMLISIAPDYKYPRSLISTVLEGALYQNFLKDHMSSITDCDSKTNPTDFFTNLVFSAIK